MRLLQALLLIMTTLLATSDGSVTPTKNQLTITTTNSTSTIKAIQKFFEADAKQNKNNGYFIVVTASGEERAGTSGQGARAGAGGTVVSSSAETKMVTVTIYNNNGLWQRFVRWWNRLFHISSSTRRLRE
ncbi:unnamed protein product [Phytophthora lilii]|uniref:Unnamed protein product n=1 Tax=Phytophthora lilii TaxID=2077276 RepID=A0A9W6YJQ5_9STRA|nr:unnamed protein product [Phytophthora lilii]